MCKWLLLILPVLLMPGCDLAEEPFRPQLVVQAILVSGEPYPVVSLSRTFPITEPIPPDGGAVSGADVVIERLGADGTPDERIEYIEHEVGSGRYSPLAARVEIEPLRRYRIIIDVPDDTGLVPFAEVVRGETLTPDTFSVVQAPPEIVPYNPLTQPIEVRATQSQYPGRQAIFMFSIIALEPESYGLTPLFAELVDPDDIEQYIEGSSPLLNEDNYEIHPDGTITLPIPWFVFAFYGPNRIVTHAVDDALFDFIRSRDAQFGATTLSPGEIAEVLTNLSHATGVFGSIARISVDVYVEE